MSGGVNYRVWNYGFSIISSLIYDLKIDRLEINITYPISETATMTEDILIKHMDVTKIETREANMSDTSFHSLAEWSRMLKSKGYIDARFDIIGYYKGKKKFALMNGDTSKVELTEWGQNNP